MELQNYINSAIPAPVTILGITLKPLCLGHIRCMARYGCGYAKEGEEVNVGIDDLLLALSICSRTEEEFNHCYTKNEIELYAKWYEFFSWTSPFRKKIPFYEVPSKSPFKRLYQRYFPKSYLGKWGKQVRKQIKHDKDFNILSKFDLFNKYRADATKAPKVWEKKGQGKVSGGKSGSHWVQAVLLTLMAEGGYTKKEALELPLSQAFYDFYKFLERNGAIEFVSAIHLQQMRMQKGEL